jgi:hypothetical protein
MTVGYAFDTAARGSGSTTGTSAATLVSLPAPASGALARYEARLIGFDAANGQGVSLSRIALVRTIGGVTSLAGVVLDLAGALGDAGLAGATATYVINGSAVELRVTGVLTRTIDWTAEVLTWA